jgi:aldose 1-epimerase
MPRELIPLVADMGGRQIRAEISTVGASVQGLSVDGMALVRGSSTAEPTATSGVVLVPWPNRVRKAQWMLDGATQYLEADEPAAGNAIHGLLANTEYSIVRAATDELVLAARIRDRRGYPFDLEIRVAYSLVRDGLDSRIEVLNRGHRAAPVALGVHPYLRLGNTPTSQLSLAIDSTRALLLGTDNLPLSSIDVRGTPYDLRGGVRVASAPAHACFTGLTAEDGRVRLRLTGGGASVEVWSDARFRWAQLYITDEFPGLESGESAIALEPMTAPPDALNSGIDLHWVRPGQGWNRQWGIAFSQAQAQAQAQA